MAKKYEKTYKTFVNGKSVTVTTDDRSKVRELAISEANKKGAKKKRKYIITSKNTPSKTNNPEGDGTV